MTAAEPRPREMDADLLRVQDLAVGWGRAAVLSGVSFTLRPGECLAFVGPNGAGKSTLVRALIGLSRPLAGTIERGPSWRVGYVPQADRDGAVLRLRADEVVAMAVSAGDWIPFRGTRTRRATARSALAEVGMERHARRVYRDLSGGQRQRIMLARALACAPTVLVLDEPTSGLDFGAEARLLARLRSLREERGIACVLVTHSLHLVAREQCLVGLLHGGRAEFGTAADLVSDARLEELYAAPTQASPDARGES